MISITINTTNIAIKNTTRGDILRKVVVARLAISPYTGVEVDISIFL